ncbi:MAG: 50S ribosomal protein L9 [Rhodospirillaceae bacterium]|jgi:large subunit ribosomal protein L9|nr:50S ribosomal protein L9 [Rhodospirillaceae bacterium]MBT4588951.1 50S ribosomal protein L9 [Rhodospirillaceae bacterium]MBT5941162.1 50S ribosomal protein L9 [Rhodospirillaceae bacterium]MBT7265361.1 50S ribosomal protein L9 [Rhodospirillaceae bacterium]
MEVILLERIEKLGQMGDVVTVKPGFARNFLLPQKKAVTATNENKEHFESQRSQLEAQNLELKSEAEKVGKKLDGEKVVMVRQAGDAGQLYGSVSARDIAVGITEAGFSVGRHQIKLDDPIKAIGMYPVLVALHPEVSVSVTVNVARSEEEAEIQDRTGEAIITTDQEVDAVEELVEVLDADEANPPSETEAEDQAKAADAAAAAEEAAAEEISDEEGSEEEE